MHLLQQHFHGAVQPIPQHFCWDCGQQTRSPRENTNRSIRSAENQITPPFISTLVFHLLPESYPLFPLLSPERQTEALTPGYLINMSNKALTSDRPAQGHSGGSHTGWPYNTKRPNGQMTGTTESNGLMATIKISHYKAEMSAVRTHSQQSGWKHFLCFYED